MKRNLKEELIVMNKSLNELEKTVTQLEETLSHKSNMINFLKEDFNQKINENQDLEEINENLYFVISLLGRTLLRKESSLRSLKVELENNDNNFVRNMCISQKVPASELRKEDVSPTRKTKQTTKNKTKKKKGKQK